MTWDTLRFRGHCPRCCIYIADSFSSLAMGSIAAEVLDSQIDRAAVRYLSVLKSSLHCAPEQRLGHPLLGDGIQSGSGPVTWGAASPRSCSVCLR